MKNKLKNNLENKLFKIIKIQKIILPLKSFNINPEYIKIISFDVANKSLAIAQLEIINIKKIFCSIVNNLEKLQSELTILQNIEKSNSKNYKKNIKENNSKSNLKSIEENYKKITELLKYTTKLIPLPINFLHLEVCDVIPGKKISETNSIDRAYGLFVKLNKLCIQFGKKWLNSDVHILIEYQMGPNKKSGEVSSQLIYHFLQYVPPENIHIIGPSLKNKLYYLDDFKSTHNYYIHKYVKLYDANKAHTNYLFHRLIEIYKLNSEKQKRLELIKKKNYNDIADAVCQAIAWIKL